MGGGGGEAEAEAGEILMLVTLGGGGGVGEPEWQRRGEAGVWRRGEGGRRLQKLLTSRWRQHNV